MYWTFLVYGVTLEKLTAYNTRLAPAWTRTASRRQTLFKLRPASQGDIVARLLQNIYLHGGHWVG